MVAPPIRSLGSGNDPPPHLRRAELPGDQGHNVNSAILLSTVPTSISPLAQALRLLKVELSQARGVTVNRQAMTQVQSAVTGVAQQTTTNALQALRTQVRSARGADGKLPPGKALRLFVQAALVDELGTELQLDPAMSDLVERTCQAIEQDSGSAALLADALRELEALAD